MDTINPMLYGAYLYSQDVKNSRQAPKHILAQVRRRFASDKIDVRYITEVGPNNLPCWCVIEWMPARQVYRPYQQELVNSGFHWFPMTRVEYWEVKDQKPLCYNDAMRALENLYQLDPKEAAVQQCEKQNRDKESKRRDFLNFLEYMEKDAPAKGLSFIGATTDRKVRSVPKLWSTPKTASQVARENK